MFDPMSRRSLLRMVSIGVPIGTIKLSAALLGTETFLPKSDRMIVSDIFPAHPPELVREMVTVAHFDLDRVKELLEARPPLAHGTGASVIGRRP